MLPFLCVSGELQHRSKTYLGTVWSLISFCFLHTFCQWAVIHLRGQHINITSLPEWADIPILVQIAAPYKNTKCWVLVSEVGISISLQCSVRLFSSWVEGTKKCVCRSMANTDILQQPFTSLAPASSCSPSQLYSSCSTTSPAAT